MSYRYDKKSAKSDRRKIDRSLERRRNEESSSRSTTGPSGSDGKNWKERNRHKHAGTSGRQRWQSNNRKWINPNYRQTYYHQRNNWSNRRNKPSPDAIPLEGLLLLQNLAQIASLNILNSQQPDAGPSTETLQDPNGSTNECDDTSQIGNDGEVDFSEEIVIEPVRRKPIISVVPLEKLRNQVAEVPNIENSSENDAAQQLESEENHELTTHSETLDNPSSAKEPSPTPFDTNDLLRVIIANQEDTLLASTSSESNNEPQILLQNEKPKSNLDDVAKRTPDEVTKKLVNQVARMDKYNIRNVINNPAMKFDAALKLHGRKKLREEIRKQLKTIDINELDKTISDHFTVDAYIDSETLPDRALIEISKTLNINLFGDKSPPYSTVREEESVKENTELTISSETNDHSDCLMEVKSEIDLGNRNKTVSTSDNDDVIVLSDSGKSDNEEGSTIKVNSKKQTKKRRKSVHEKVVDTFKKTVLPNVPFKERKQYEAKDNSNVSNAIHNIYNMCIDKLGNSTESPKNASPRDKNKSKRDLSDEEAVRCLMDNIQNLFQKNNDRSEQSKDNSKQGKDTTNTRISEGNINRSEKVQRKRHRNDAEISSSATKKKQKSSDNDQDKIEAKSASKSSTPTSEGKCKSSQKNKDVDKSKRHKDNREEDRSSRSNKRESYPKKPNKEIKNSKQAATSQKSEKENTQTNSKSSKKSNYNSNEKESRRSSQKSKSNEISTHDSMQSAKHKNSPTKSSSTALIQEKYVSTSEDISKRKKTVESAKSIAKPSKDATTESDDGCRYRQKSNRLRTEDEPTLSCDSSSNKPIDSSICRKTFSDSCTTDTDEGVNVAKTLEESNKNKISSTRERQQSEELRSCHILDSSRTQSIQIASKDNHLDRSPSDKSNAELLPGNTMTKDTEIANQCVNGVNEIFINPSINLKSSINNSNLDRVSDSGSECIMQSPTHCEYKPRTWKSPGEKKCLVQSIASPLSSPTSSERLTTTDSSSNGQAQCQVSSGISDEELVSTISTHEEKTVVTGGHSEDESLSSDSESNETPQNAFGINQVDSIRLQMLMQQNKVSDAVLNSLKEYDLKLMELQKQKMFIEEMLLKLQKEKMTVEVATIKLQTEKYLILNSILGQNHLKSPLSNIENISNTIPFLSANQISTSSHLFNGSFNIEAAIAAATAQSQLSNLEPTKAKTKKAPKKKYIPKNSEFSRKLKNRKKRCQRDILIEDATKAFFKDDGGEQSNLFTIPSRRSQSVAPSDTSKASPNKIQNDDTTDLASSRPIKTENISADSAHPPKDNSPNKNDNGSKKLRECKVLEEKDDDLSQHSPSSGCIIIDDVDHLVISDDDDDDETNSPEFISDETTFEISNGNLEGYKMPITCLQVVHKYLIAASEDGNIYKFNLLSHDLESVFTKHTECVTNIKIIGNNCIYSISLDGYLKKTSVENFGLEMVSVNVQEPLQSIDLEWNTAFMGSRWGNVFTYNIKTGKLCETLLCSLGSSIMAIKATKEGPRRILIISSKGNQVNLRDAKSGLLLRIISIPNDTNVYSVIMSEGVIYFGTNKDEIFVFDLPSANKVASYTCGNGAVSMKLYKKNLLFVGCYDGFIYVINKSTGAQIGRFPGSGKVVLSLDIVADKLITSSRDNHLQIMDIPSYILALVKN